MNIYNDEDLAMKLHCVILFYKNVNTINFNRLSISTFHELSQRDRKKKTLVYRQTKSHQV